MRFPNRLASSIMGNTGRLHDYKRNGTTTLFAALNVAEGKIIGRCMRKHRHQERLGFLKVLEAETPAELDPHLIVDNYATHNSPVKKSSRRAILRQHRLSACFRACAARPKNRPAADFSSSDTTIRLFNRADKHAKVMKWFKKHPRFHMHFTPTSSSWLNPVERWFRELTEKCILRGVFVSVDSLVKSVEEFIDGFNADSTGHKWTTKVDETLEKVRRARAVLDNQ